MGPRAVFLSTVMGLGWPAGCGRISWPLSEVRDEEPSYLYFSVPYVCMHVNAYWSETLQWFL